MGKAYTFGDNIDTDLIVPGKYLTVSDPAELGKVCMEGFQPGFASLLNKGDIFVAGANFGCGSSREHAPISIRAVGIGCVIAVSFARIFYRNAINIGLPVLESPEAAAEIRAGDDIEVAFAEGVIQNKSSGKKYCFTPFPVKIMEIINAGGLQQYYQNRK